MSRHTIDALSSDHEVVVGYDRPLDNFFGTVYDRKGDVVRWIPSEDSPEAVAEQLTAYAVVSPALLTTLRTEREHRATHPMRLAADHRTAAGR